MEAAIIGGRYAEKFDHDVRIISAKKVKNALVRQLKASKNFMDLEGVSEVCSDMFYSTIGDGK